MKKSVLLFFTFSCLLLSDAAAQKWITWTDKNGRFSIDFPESPDLLEDPKSSYGSFSMGPTLSLSIADSSNNRANFIMLCTDFPESSAGNQSDNSKQVSNFGLWTKIFVGMSNCRASSEKDTIHYGFPAKIVIGQSIPGERPMHFKFVLVKNRVYSLAVECKNDSIWMDHIGKFFSSLHILEKELP